jgi:hypothetical protein
MSPANRRRTAATIATAGLMASVLGLVISLGSKTSTSPDVQATATAADLLGRVVLPAGTVRYEAVPPHELAQAPERQMIDDQVERHALYRAPMPPEAALSDVQRHGIIGLTFSGTGSTGTPQGIVLRYLRAEQNEPPPGVYHSEVLVSAVSHDTTESLLRVDAVVVWQPHRTPVERLPTMHQSVTIDRTTRPVEPSSGQPTTQHRMVTDPATVTRLVTIFNRLPAAPPAGLSSGGPVQVCAMFGSITAEFARTAGQGGKLTATTGFGCLAAPDHSVFTVMANGHDQPALSDPNDVFVAALTNALAYS